MATAQRKWRSQRNLIIKKEQRRGDAEAIPVEPGERVVPSAEVTKDVKTAGESTGGRPKKVAGPYTPLEEELTRETNKIMEDVYGKDWPPGGPEQGG